MSGPTQHTPAYATPADVQVHGPYGPGRLDAAPKGVRALYPFHGRITADGSSGYPAAPGRYHIYNAWHCPWAHRSAIVRKLAGLEDVVSLSYVDDERDARGWAFRERRGPDPVNGFTLLAQAYEASEPGFAGHISVPTLWDRVTGRIVSNHYPDITLDLATEFEEWADPSVRLYPAESRAEIDELNEQILRDVNTAAPKIAGAATQETYEQLRGETVAALERLDERLADRRFLLGDAITEADVRLWVTLARFDLADNPAARISERGLTDFTHLWAYARDLYQHPAFRDTTDFATYRHSAFARAEGVKRIDVEPFQGAWDSPHGRESLDVQRRLTGMGLGRKEPESPVTALGH
ncbi:glutathione S-transferase C-terminal domain-containing protein [Nonomuraea sp. NPDC049129]|uniref:glutathione S-transferase C-terminal domain-containing protein n=1 Tax=Nonomuraea sp. NPDC049129 TaxID=3155272 RepID=UPI0033C509C2